MNPFMLALVLLSTMTVEWREPTPADVQLVEGSATYYRIGLMEQVVENRDIDVPDGFIPVTLNRRGDLGRIVWVRFPRSDTLYPAISVDCAQRGEHYEKRLELGYVLEVSAKVAIAEGFYGVDVEPVEVWYVFPFELFAGRHIPM